MTSRMMSFMFWIILVGILIHWNPVSTRNHSTPGIVCPSILPVRVSALNSPPLVEPSEDGAMRGVMGHFFGRVIKKCFEKKCNLTQQSIQNTLFNTTCEFLSSIEDNKTDIAFPLTRPMKMWLSDDNYSGPKMVVQDFLSSPGYSLIMDVEYVNRKANEIIVKSLVENTWPIIVFTLLIAGISGIIVWILETHFNEEEFPRSFTKGSYEGFWWAFVSMTTVGYGDKTPKFIFGRLFGIAWILIGLVVIAMFTATATSALNVSFSDLAVLEGTSIGVLKNTSAGLEAKKRGAKVAGFPSAGLLFRELKSHRIQGIFMDKYKASYYLHRRNETTLKVFKTFDENVDYSLAVREASEISKMDKNSCFKTKMQKRNVDDFLLQYLKPIESYNHDSDSTGIFSGTAKSTQRFLLITMGVFLGFVLLGIMGELIYQKMWKAKKKVEDDQDGNELKEVKAQSKRIKGNFKDLEDKVAQLLREVSKLREQLVTISAQGNGTFATSTTHM